MQIAQLLKQTERHRENILFFTTQAPSIDAQTKLQNAIFLAFKYFYVYFFSLSISLSVHFSTLLISNENTYEHAPSYTHTHTQTHVRSSLPRSHSLSDMKLSLGDVKRQQRERKYKCSANGFCGDVTVAASVGDRWKR